MTPATRRRPRIRTTRVPCPHCGEETTVQVWPLLYVVGQRAAPDAAMVASVSCNRHCGGDVPIRAGDVRRAA